MSYEDTLKLLDASGITYTMHEHQPFLTVADMETHLSFPKEQFLKTLAFKIKNSFWVLAAMQGDARADYRKLAATLGISRSHIIRPTPEEIGEVLGMAAGGVCPIPTAGDVRVVVDATARMLERVYCGGVRNDRTLEIGMDDLLRVANAQVAPIVQDSV